MHKEIAAALAAAKKYKPKNHGSQAEAEVCVTLLTDALMHVERLDELADAWEKTERLRKAQLELNAAQA